MPRYVANKDFGKFKKGQQFDETEVGAGPARALVAMGSASAVAEAAQKEQPRRGRPPKAAAEYQTRDMAAQSEPSEKPKP